MTSQDDSEKLQANVQSAELIDWEATDFPDWDASIPWKNAAGNASQQPRRWKFFKQIANFRKKWENLQAHHKMLVTVHLGGSVLVLLGNVLWIAVAHKIDSDSPSVLYFGSCKTTGQLDTGLHLLINILSTLLFWSSGFCIQLLLSPTRNDLDIAHENGRWLDVGIPSIRNFFHVHTDRRVVCAITWITSVGLHLYWNSAVYMSKPTSTYSVGIATSDYLTYDAPWAGQDSSLDFLQSEGQNWNRISPEDCLERYLPIYGAGRDVIVVTNSTNHTYPYVPGVDSSLINSFTIDTGLWSNNWMCWYYEETSPPITKFCTIEVMKQFASDWLIKDALNVWGPYRVEHCLSQGTLDFNNMCSLLLSYDIMILVCVVNAIQCICIAWTLFHNKGGSNKPLITLGDAIASFLERPDDNTHGAGMLTRSEASSGFAWAHRGERWKSKNGAWSPRPRIGWYRSPGLLNWTFATIIIVGGVVAAVVAVWLAVRSVKEDGISITATNIWSLGLSQGHIFSFIQTVGGQTSKPGAFMNSVFTANSIQVAVNIAYQYIFAQIASMTVSREWLSYCRLPHTASPGRIRRFLEQKLKLRPRQCGKGLRVSVMTLNSAQESPSFLSLPLKMAVPLATGLALLQWIISQSFFLVQTAGYNGVDGSRNTSFDETLVGFSLPGLVLLLFVTFPFALFILSVWFFKYDEGTELMPFASTSSVAVSAACHPPHHDSSAHLGRVSYGLVQMRGGKGHCSFTTAADVRPVIREIPYE